MEKKNKIKEEAICSILEYEKKYFPNSYKKKLEDRRDKSPKTYGTGLAAELLESVKRKLEHISGQ